MVIKDPWIRALVIVMLLIAGVYLTGLLWQVAVEFADIILLFFLAWVISFMIEPVVARLHIRARFPRNLAVLAAYLGVLVVVSFAIVQLVPRLSAQLIQVANDLPIYVAWMTVELLRWQSVLGEQGIQIAPESLITYQEVARRIEALGPLLLSNAVGVATGVANLLFQALIVLILSYYMTLDGHRINAALLLALPHAYRDDARYFMASVHRAFAGFMRGQFALAVIYGSGTAVIMSVLGLNLVLLSSVAAGGFMLLPFIGPFLAIVLPLLVALVTKPESFLAVAIALFVLQQIVVNVVAPRLMSQTVGLHPLLVFVAVLGGAKLAGVWGAVFGVPIVGVGAAMVSFYRATVDDRQARLRAATSELVMEEGPIADAGEALEREASSTPARPPGPAATPGLGSVPTTHAGSVPRGEAPTP